MAAFSTTEKTILEMRLQGITRKGIADKLCRSEMTIKTHFQNMAKKSNAHDEVDLIVWYLKIEKGIIIAVLIIVLLAFCGIDFLSIIDKMQTNLHSIFNWQISK